MGTTGPYSPALWIPAYAGMTVGVAGAGPSTGSGRRGHWELFPLLVFTGTSCVGTTGPYSPALWIPASVGMTVGVAGRGLRQAQAERGHWELFPLLVFTGTSCAGTTGPYSPALWIPASAGMTVGVVGAWPSTGSGRTGALGVVPTGRPTLSPVVGEGEVLLSCIIRTVDSLLQRA